MARIVLGMGSSHTPLLSLPVEEWSHRATADYNNPGLNLSDGRLITYAELEAEVGQKYNDEATVDVFREKARLCDAALDRLADELEAAAPDIVIIVGDDQDELFGSANRPAISIYYGDKLVMWEKYGASGTPDWLRTVGQGYLMDDRHELQGAPDFAREIIRGLLDRDVDVSTSDGVADPAKAAFGHAYGFIVKRLFKGRTIPVLPVLLNTYYPPNVPSARRCHDIGKALRAAIEAAQADLKVAVIASGGLSHFVVDEKLDREVIAGFSQSSAEMLRNIPRDALNSGSSEILNWVLTAGAVHDMALSWIEYVPIRRTPAGTGVGVAFGVWGGLSARKGA
jgi:hypothetical protein